MKTERVEHRCTITVCVLSGQIPTECGLAACDNGCYTRDLTFIPLSVLSALAEKFEKRAEAADRNANRPETSYFDVFQTQRDTFREAAFEVRSLIEADS